MMKKCSFKLCLTDLTSSNMRIIDNLKSILNEKLNDQYSLEIQCADEKPELPGHSISFSTPILIKQSPPPSSIFAGNFNDKENLSAMIDFSMH